jgi:hypothetical protein
MLEDLRQNAFRAQFTFERKQEVKRKAAQEEAQKRKQEQTRLRSALLEAAFDGDAVGVAKLLDAAAGVLDDAVCTLGHLCKRKHLAKLLKRCKALTRWFSSCLCL